MVIDVHTHLYGPGLAPPFWINAMAKYGGAVACRTEEYVRGRIESDWYAENGDLLVQDMDAAGIEKSVVFALDFGPYCDVDDDISLEKRYELFARAVARHPDRLVLFGGIDPRRPSAARFVESAVEEWGIRGVKLWTPAGFRPNESYCYRLYERCAQLGLPVVVHTGQEIGPLHSDSTLPIFVDQPANDFPEITFVLAHAGMGWSREAGEIAWHHQNVYLDIAAWQGVYLRSPRQFISDLRQLVAIAGKDKVLFGSDWPAFRTISKVDSAAWVAILRALADPEADSEPPLTAEQVELMLGGTARRALEL
jgi:predicted TIM-barrel fold metal-dependent hydrolase